MYVVQGFHFHSEFPVVIHMQPGVKHGFRENIIHTILRV